MSKNRARSIKCRQIKMREMNVIVEGTPATPIVSGLDKLAFNPVIDNGAGDYSIDFTKSQFTVLDPMIQITMITTEAVAVVAAVSNKIVTINTFAMDGTTPKEADFYLTIKGNDFKFNV